MKKTISLACALLAITFASLQAQTLKVATVDVQKALTHYYKDVEAQKKIEKSLKLAQEQGSDMVKEGQQLVEEYQALAEEAENVALSESARNQAKADAQLKLQEIKQKESELREFRSNIEKALMERQRSTREVLLEDVRLTIKEVAQGKGANLVFDTSGMASSGVPAVVYADPSWDITTAVLAKLNADAPADFVAPADKQK